MTRKAKVDTARELNWASIRPAMVADDGTRRGDSVPDSIFVRMFCDFCDEPMRVAAVLPEQQLCCKCSRNSAGLAQLDWGERLARAATIPIRGRGKHGIRAAADG